MIKDLSLDTLTTNGTFLLPVYPTLPPSASRKGALAYQISDSAIYVWQGTSWQPVAASGSINVITQSPILGGQSVSLGGTITLSHASSPAAGGPYGSASTGTVPSLTVDSTGHISVASQAVLPSLTVQGDGTSISGSGTVFGIGSSITFSLTPTGVVQNTYGSSLFIPQFDVGLDGRLTSASSVVPAPMTITPSGPLTVSGPLTLGGTITITNTALLDADVNQNWRTGTSSTFGASTTNSIVIGHSATTVASSGGSVAIGISSKAGTTSVVVGYATGASVTAGRNVFLGYQAGNSSTGGTGSNVFIGCQAGNTLTFASNTICIGDSSGTAAGSLLTSSSAVCIGQGTEIQDNCVVIGYQAKVANNGNMAIGWTATATGISECTAIGPSVTNSTQQTTLIGVGGLNTHVHTVESTGYFKSYQACGAKAGQNPGSQTINSSATAIVNLPDVFYDTGYPQPYADPLNNRIYVGSFGSFLDDPLQIFSINVAMIGIASVPSFNGYAELIYVDENGLSSVVASCFCVNETTTQVAFNMSTNVRIGAVISFRPYINVRLTNVGASNVNLIFVGASVTRMV
jgi:hypothetical protein